MNNTFESFNKQNIKKAVEHWQNNHHDAFNGIENDPVVNLLLTALSHQAFQIEKNIENYEENTVRNLRDRIIPHQLIKPVPAFSIVETQINNASEDNFEKIIDETCSFEFEKNKKKFTFFPLLTTKIISAECEKTSCYANSITINLTSQQNIQNLSGLSLFFDCQKSVEIESIAIVGGNSNYELPLIKPNQYNELPFTKMFNNQHWFMKENHNLFGTYDFWQEIFVTNTTNLYYIDNYNSKDLPVENPQNIELKIIFKENVEDIDVKINCIPIIQVEKKDVCLSEAVPIKEFETETGEFLNLLTPEDENNPEKYTNSFFVRQFGVERYNPKILINQLQEIADRYTSDYYAFQNIESLKFGNKLDDLKESITNILSVLDKNSEENNWNKEGKKNCYYAVLRKDINEKKLYINYLITSGENANGIKKGELATKTSQFLNKQKTKLLYETKSGKNSIKDETEKENIVKYYLLTGDKLVTAADIRAFCRKELGECIEGNINLRKEKDCILIEIKLNENNPKIDANSLTKKIELRSTGAVSYKVCFL